MRWFLLFAFVMGCGSSSDDSGGSAAPSGLVIPAGEYRLSRYIAAGQEITTLGTASVAVAVVGSKTQFTLSGDIVEGYSCKPRVWLAKIDTAGDASEIERSQENCTESKPKAEFEALKRNYRMNGTGFIERITDGETQIEVYYDKK